MTSVIDRMKADAEVCNRRMREVCYCRSGDAVAAAAGGLVSGKRQREKALKRRLKLLKGMPDEWTSWRDIAAITGSPESTIKRILADMCACGMVERRDNPGKATLWRPVR